MKMTIDQLAKRLGTTPATIMSLRKTYPKEAPRSFGNVPAWQAFALSRASDLRFLNRDFLRSFR